MRRGGEEEVGCECEGEQEICWLIDLASGELYARRGARRLELRRSHLAWIGQWVVWVVVIGLFYTTWSCSTSRLVESD